jgi:uncharacterized repeat protein (TIGR01451 family)
MVIKAPIIAFLFLVVCCAFGPAAALAAEAGPQWTVTSVSHPTNFKPGGEGVYVVTITNTGGAATDGSTITITDELPEGLSLARTGAAGEDELAAHDGLGGAAKLSCVFSTCTYTGAVVPGGPATPSVVPDDTLMLRVPVDVSGDPPASCPAAAPAVSCVTNVVRVAGGGAPDASLQTPTVISDSPAGFGIAAGGASTALSSTQAGAHPDVTTSIAFNTVNAAGALAGDVKDTIDELPPGFASDFVDTPSCPAGEFKRDECPVGTQIGVVTLTLVEGLSGAEATVEELQPVYDISPDPGEIAKLGFNVGDGQFLFEGAFTLRSDYGATVTFADAEESLPELDNVSLTVWGVPADPIHNPLRLTQEAGAIGHFGASSSAALVPFVTNPTFCEATPLAAKFRVTSWEQPDEDESPEVTPMPFGPIGGCDRLAMSPEFTVEATTSSASSPTGLNLDMRIPQTYENAAGLATSNLKKAVVTLPEGMTVNPSAGSGLGACSEAEYEEEPLQYTPGLGCPNDSKLGSVKIQTPALKEEATGSVFLAEPAPLGEAGRNPFGSLLALYIIARIPERGVLVRAAGEVSANPLTGQLVTTFDTTKVSAPHSGLPPLPFGLLTFSFRQGTTSPLVTPAGCGSYGVKAALTPWSAPERTPLVPVIAPFAITSAFDGGSCPSGGAPPFAPQVIAGSQDNDAGSYSPFYVRIIRGDGEQEITGFSSQLPAGLTANLSGVPFCSEAQIALARTKTGTQEEAEPSCPTASQIGHTLVGAGVGSVLAYAPGKIYMAGPFEGAPFSIVAITSAKVGPFDLGTVVVHLPLQINPLTAAVSVAAGGADQIPHIIDGIVIHVRDIRVYIDRPGFTLNPTSCERATFAATVIGSGQSFTNPTDDVPVTIRDPFQAADCQNLQFKPAFKVSTAGRTSRLDGASLVAKLTYPVAPQDTQANIRSVKVELPKQLPSRLTTLQKACTAAQFEANPAGCPPASLIGHAKAVTPILPVPLEGPAYFVSHGGEAFPSLVVVLQGYGVRIDLVGSTFISKKGITSSTFKTVPDQPVSSFELTLPEGPYSALAANGNLCKSKKLTMPTTFTAQNGAVIQQSTKLAVTGCPKASKVKAKKRKRKTREHKRKAKEHKEARK